MQSLVLLNPLLHDVNTFFPLFWDKYVVAEVNMNKQVSEE